MRNRNLIFVLTILVILSILLRKLGFGVASILLNISTASLALVVVFSGEIFRTLLARLVLAASLIGALAILQYWLESDYIIIPVVLAFFFFMLFSYKYIKHKPSGVLIFIPVSVIYLLAVLLNPRQFHNLFRPTGYEDFVLAKFRQDQGVKADVLINTYKKTDLAKSDEYLAEAFREDSLKNYTAALEYYNRCIENNPDNATAYHRRGFVKLTRLELNPPNAVSALKDFSRAIRLKPDFAEAYYHRSMAYHYLGNKQRAYLDQLKVLQLDSLMNDSLFELRYGRSKKSLSIPPDS